MEKLKAQYNKNGYTFKLLIREGDVAIYSQILPETGQVTAYEVFEVLKRGETKIGDKIIKAGEAVPGNEQWGVKGYTVHSIFEAKQKVALLQSNISRRKLARTYHLVC